MVVSDPDAALHLLGEHGMLAFVNEVLFLKLANKAGALAQITATLAKKRINVDYAYGSAGPRVRNHGFYIRVSNVKRAVELLKSVAGVD